ncbi:hypothetical protein [Salimicrobium flavidum]
MSELLAHPDEAIARQVMREFLQMKKVDIHALEAVREHMEKNE